MSDCYYMIYANDQLIARKETRDEVLSFIETVPDPLYRVYKINDVTSHFR